MFQKVANFWCLSLQVLAKETTLPKPREDPEGLLGSGRTLWSCAGSVKMSTWNKSLFTLARLNFTYFVFTKTRPGSTVFENHRKGLVQHCEVRLSWVDKSSLKMPKIVKFGEFLKAWSLRGQTVLPDKRQNRWKCQNWKLQMKHFISLSILFWFIHIRIPVRNFGSWLKCPPYIFEA